MTKKFTEEQYHKINNIDFGSMDEQESKEVLYVALDTFDIKQETLNLARALTNPLTREQAHDKFVEKEKHYIWKLNGLYLVKSTGDGSIFFGSSDAAMALSESQIKEWGLNPEMFNKEEV